MFILDGGLGHELVKRCGQPAHPLWSVKTMLEQPELVRQVHQDFVRAGARGITLNTYTATPTRMARDGQPGWLEACHATAIQAAQDAATEGTRVLGCLPPLVASYRADLAPDRAAAVAEYRILVGLQAAAVDGFLAETLPTYREASAALEAALEVDRPVWVSLVPSETQAGLLRSGEPLREVAERLVDQGAEAILLNCASPEAIDANLPSIRGLGVEFGAYGNAFVSVDALQVGGTVDVLQERKDISPAIYLEYAKRWAELGATILGGCCGIGVEHIAALSQQWPASKR